jgi:thiol:disulfide interchange protein DsbD
LRACRAFAQERMNLMKAETLLRLAFFARRSHDRSGAQAVANRRLGTSSTCLPGAGSGIARLGFLKAAGLLGALAIALLFCAPFSAGAQEPKVLPPKQAFPYSASATDAHVLVRFNVSDGYYLYRKRFEFASTTPGVTLGAPAFPKGEMHSDEFFGEQEIYRREFEIRVPYQLSSALQGFDVALKLQGCADVGLCYPPQNWSTQVTLPPGVAVTASSGNAAAATAGQAEPAATSAALQSGPVVSEQDKLAAALQGDSLAYALLTFFLAGLVLSFTPCVLPMIPILSGIIVGQGENVTRARGFSLAFTYVQGMALTYAAAGAIFVLAFKQAPQAFFQQPWIITLMVLLFIALALSMFGFYTIEMPSAMQTRLTSASNRQKSGTYIGTFIMGALSALVVTACVAPAIIAALSVISQSRQVVRGAAALYATGLGMGVPLLIVGASAGNLLPKAGPWMDAVKSLFGVIFLGVAIYLATPLLPDAVTMLLWSALALVSGFWIFSFKARDGGPAPATVRGVGLIGVCYGVLLLIGAASGSHDPLQPLDRLAATQGGASGANEAALTFQPIKTIADLERAMASATAAGKPVMLDFYADWCVSCKEMEKYTFPDPAVQAALANAVLLKADVTANDDADQALLARFGIFGPPTIAFFGPDGVERKNFRLVGFTSAEPFTEHVKGAFAG